MLDSWGARGLSDFPSMDQRTPLNETDLLRRIATGDGDALSRVFELHSPVVLGLELELMPERDPYTLKPGEALPVRLLYHGKPLDGALVVGVASPGVSGARVSARTAGGRAALVLDRPGLWLVKAVHMVPAPEGSGAEWESLWASLTFELPTP